MPFARRKNAEIHIRIDGGVNNIEINRSIEDKISIPLRMSPLRMNRPLMKRRPEQKSRNWIEGFDPKTSMRKAKAAARSIAPRIFTRTIKNWEEGA